MTPEPAVTELRGGLEIALWVGGPLLLVVLIVGVVIGVIQAATQLNEPTIAFVAIYAVGALLVERGQTSVGEIVVYNDKTLEEIARIPSLVTPTGKFNVYNTMRDIY